MSASTDAIQQLYVEYFNRPADYAGLNYWVAIYDNSIDKTAVIESIASAFSQSAEYTDLFANKPDTFSKVSAIYSNLFGRTGELAGVNYWAAAIDSGALSLSDAACEIAKGAQGSDLTILTNKVAAATAFTNSLDTVDKALAYSGSIAIAQASAWLTSQADVSWTTPTADQTAALATVLSALGAVSETYDLTTGIDTFTGGAGNDTFNAANVGAVQSLSSFDKINGDGGSDTLNILSVGNAFDDSTTSNLTVSGIEEAIVTSDRKVVLNTSTWTDLTKLTVVAAGATSGTTSVTADDTTAVSVTNTNAGGNSTVVNGGSTVTVNVTDASGGGTITVGNSIAPTGAVNITSANTGSNVSSGSINIQGGSTINIESDQHNNVNTTNTNGSVNILGSTATTGVTVTNAAKATASASVAGVNANSVSITDVNGGADSAGTITSVSVSSFTTLGITDNALTTLNVAYGSGNIIIDNSGLTTPTNKTLALTVNGQTGGTLDDADIYTTLNVTTTGTNSKLANITTGGVTALTVAGSKDLTLTSSAGLTALKTVTVSGAAGLSADLSAASITAVDTSATTGSSKVTIDASKATFTGGDGVDLVTVSGATVTKTISLGAGDDSVIMTSVNTTPTAQIISGEGSDSISMTAALAATASANATFAGQVIGFEKLGLTGATNQTIDLSVLGGFDDVTTSGGNGLTLSNIGSGGNLTLNGAGTAYTVSDSSFATGKSDVLNLNLTDGSGSAVAFASTGITASGVETINIAVTDTQATPTGKFNDSVTLLGNSVETIAVTGNAGLTLTAVSTALTNVDASGITLGDFSWTSGALTAAATVQGSAKGTNTITASAATAAVTYTGGTGNDTFTATNGKSNSISLGDGTNSATVSSGNNTITGGKDADTVVATTGNNIVNLGDGTNSFTATTGNNTYTGGTGVDTVTVGGGLNSLTLGTGADSVKITTAGANGNVYTTITDIDAGDTIDLSGLTTVVSADGALGAKLTLGDTAAFADYLAAGAATVIADAGASTVKWFEFSGNTYIVIDTTVAANTPDDNNVFENGVDSVVKLTGLVDLSTSTLATDVLTIV